MDDYRNNEQNDGNDNGVFPEREENIEKPQENGEPAVNQSSEDSPKSDYEAQNGSGYGNTDSQNGYGNAENQYQNGYVNTENQSADGSQRNQSNYGYQNYQGGYSSNPQNSGYSYQGNGSQNYNKPVYGSEQPLGGESKKKNTGMRVFIIIIVAIVAIAAVAIAVIFTKSSGSSSNNNTVSNSSDETTTNSVSGEENVDSITASSSSVEAGEAAEVAEIAQAYNVGVLIYQNDSLYTEGSGVIAQEDETGTYTYIITCAHVINYSSVDISVLMADGTEYAAEVVGFDTRTDIGVVRIEASGLTCAEFADSDELIVGQTVYAVGNPGGSEFFGSITNGIISAIDRPITSSTNYEMECIQHTAAINPGNSGGALVNGEGKVIGINSMKIASTEYEGMGFAVPSNVVVSVFNSIIENGYVAGRAKLGISYASPSNYSQTYSMYVQMKGLPSGTIVIAEIDSESAFADTDVQVGDMITAVNGTDMTDTGMLADMIEDMSVGDTITLTIVRVDTTTWTQTEFDVTVTLVEDKSGTSVEEETTTSSSSMEDWYEYFRQYYGY